MAICTEFVRRDGTGWAVELDALDDAVPGGISRNRLKSMLQKLIEHGYLLETGRTIGGRHVTAKRSHDLLLPAPPAVHVTDETCTASGAGLAETCTASGSNLHRYGFKPAPLAVHEVPSELGGSTPLGTSIGTSVGTPLFDEYGKQVAVRTFNCHECKDDGWLLDEEGQPVEPAVRCSHPSRSRNAS
jgi:hypothetical protein